MTTKTPDQIKQELTALYAAYQQRAQAEFRAAFDGLFAKHADLQTVSFQCYAAYFNDGDECPFRARTDYPSFNGADRYEDQQPVSKACETEVRTLLRAFPHDVYETMFGNNTEVVVSREGVSVTDYTDHD